jgi:hypothetical protein
MRVLLALLVVAFLVALYTPVQAIPDGLPPVPEPTVTVEGQFVPVTPEPTAVGGTVPFPPVKPVRPTPNVTPVPIDPTFARPNLLFLPMLGAGQ